MKLHSFQFRLSTLLFAPVIVAIVLVIVLTANRYEIIDLHYDRVIENVPLLTPVRIRTLNESGIELEDGRCFVLTEGSIGLDSLRVFISSSGDSVEIRQRTDNPEVFD